MRHMTNISTIIERPMILAQDAGHRLINASPRIPHNMLVYPPSRWLFCQQISLAMLHFVRNPNRLFIAAFGITFPMGMRDPIRKSIITFSPSPSHFQDCAAIPIAFNIKKIQRA